VLRLRTKETLPPVLSLVARSQSQESKIKFGKEGEIIFGQIPHLYKMA